MESVPELEIAGRPGQVANFVPEISTDRLAADPQMREIANQLSRWVDNARAATGRTSMFDRGVYTPPENPYDEMRAARHAVRYDSVVSGAHEITESFAFQGVKWECENSDEADVFNQLARDMNLDGVLRKMWREEFTYGQFVCAKLWGWVEYTVRGYMPPEEEPLETYVDPMDGMTKTREPLDETTGRPKKKATKGQKRKKKYRFWAPLQLRILDSCKVVPVGTGPLGGEQLAWQATPGEIGYYQSSYTGDVIDPLMTAFFQGTYDPGWEETTELAQLGVNTSRLLLMNPQWVFRHTQTKPDYERFADIRLKSVFQLLDLKKQLMASDRAMLIGAANYILLIRKGDKDAGATPEEMENLKQNYNFIAKMPVIISDHRLQVDIIAPKTDTTLDEKKYQTLNAQIAGRLMGVLQSTASSAGRTDDQSSLSLALARVMENRRHMLARTIELEVARAIVNHPKNKGIFDAEPSLVWTPRSLALSMDTQYVQGLLTMRQNSEISRETILEFFGLDEQAEAMRMEIEQLHYDHIFQTQVAFSAPAGGAPGMPPGAPGAAGASNLHAPGQPFGSGQTPPGQTKDGPNKKGAGATGNSLPASGKPADGKARTGPNGKAEPPGASGARGGRPRGGGQTAPTKTAKPRTPRGNTSTKGK